MRSSMTVRPIVASVPHRWRQSVILFSDWSQRCQYTTGAGWMLGCFTISIRVGRSYSVTRLTRVSCHQTILRWLDHSVGGPIPDVVMKAAPDSYIARAKPYQHTTSAWRGGRRHRDCFTGNKLSRQAFQRFTNKARDLLRSGVNLLVIDLFPPTRRDPQGIHEAIWEQFADDAFELPADKTTDHRGISHG